MMPRSTRIRPPTAGGSTMAALAKLDEAVAVAGMNALAEELKRVTNAGIGKRRVWVVLIHDASDNAITGIFGVYGRAADAENACEIGTSEPGKYLSYSALGFEVD